MVQSLPRSLDIHGFGLAFYVDQRSANSRTGKKPSIRKFVTFERSLNASVCMWTYFLRAHVLQQLFVAPFQHLLEEGEKKLEHGVGKTIHHEHRDKQNDQEGKTGKGKVRTHQVEETSPSDSRLWAEIH